ncbi:hypothetical protein BKA63DRAFT_429190 [Paraphoma chrysanthemicola]|nr:hypothetical protein BKA63DRAFT_429190 [Paraphoma chrysanthemicola]
MDGSQLPPDWSLDENHTDIFDNAWAANFDAAEFESTMTGPSYPNRSFDDLSTPLILDDFTMNPALLEGPAEHPETITHGDSFPLQQFVQQAIPSGSHNASPTQSLALQRWQNSPPEDEAASLSAIYNAMEQRPQSGGSRGSHTPNLDAFRTHRGPSSTTSLDSGVSDASLQSVNSNHSATSQSRRRKANKNRVPAKAKSRKPKDSANRIFKCTFCCDDFLHKYDWARHEKSLHLNLEEWICAPNGGSVVLPLTGRVHCAYCSALDPTHDHLESHNYSACQGGQSTPRTFRRKDHLVQHLRLVHGLDTLPLIDDWKVASAPITSRCGFCDAKLANWEERTDHLAAHFRQGKTMHDWRGNHEFEPDVNARVSNAFPPYLIAAQAMTMVPFSATNHDSIDHNMQVLSQMDLEVLASSLKLNNEPTSPLPAMPTITDEHTPNFPTDQGVEGQQGAETRLFADVLSRHLARFARQQMMLGIVPTDEMFQRESRRILYQDADDAWNQTVADNPEWIQEFRERTGFNQNSGS